MIYKILLPFDSSANSIKALNFVKDLAFKLNAKVFLLSVFGYYFKVQIIFY